MIPAYMDRRNLWSRPVLGFRNLFGACVGRPFVAAACFQQARYVGFVSQFCALASGLRNLRNWSNPRRKPGGLPHYAGVNLLALLRHLRLRLRRRLAQIIEDTTAFVS